MFDNLKQFMYEKTNYQDDEYNIMIDTINDQIILIGRNTIQKYYSGDGYENGIGCISTFKEFEEGLKEKGIIK